MDSVRIASSGLGMDSATIVLTKYTALDTLFISRYGRVSNEPAFRAGLHHRRDPVAVIVLSVGVMALVGSSALATRLIGRGNESSGATQVVPARADLLRAYAAQTAPACANRAVSRPAATRRRGIAEAWVLLGAAGDPTRDVPMTFTYPVPGGTRTEAMVITLYCK